MVSLWSLPQLRVHIRSTQTVGRMIAKPHLCIFANMWYVNS